MKTCCAVIALALMAGCGVSRQVPGAGDGAVLTTSSALAGCDGAEPRVRLADLVLAPVDAILAGHPGSGSADLPDLDIEVTFPLPSSLLAEELKVFLSVPYFPDASQPTLNEDLSQPTKAFIVTGKPVPSVAVQDTTVFSSDAGQQAQGNLLAIERSGDGSALTLCLLFRRQSPWFRPDTVLLYAPALSVL